MTKESNDFFCLAVAVRVVDTKTIEANGAAFRRMITAISVGRAIVLGDQEAIIAIVAVPMGRLARRIQDTGRGLGVLDAVVTAFTALGA